jgi:hypothetical protein
MVAKELAASVDRLVSAEPKFREDESDPPNGWWNLRKIFHVQRRALFGFDQTPLLST